MKTIKTYSELITLPSFIDRFNYLKLDGSVGLKTFGFDRYLNQAFYRSPEWRKARNHVLLRDNGCDLGCEDRMIFGKVMIHHMNPVTERDLLERNPVIFDPEFLICVSIDTHNAIHYSDESALYGEPVERRKNDTRLW